MIDPDQAEQYLYDEGYIMDVLVLEYEEPEFWEWELN